MKPRTKEQKEVERLSKRVSPISESQISWMRKNFIYDAYASNGTYICPVCHERIYDNQSGICPSCGAKVRPTGMRRYHQEYFFTALTTIGGWQVARLIYAEQYCFVRKENSDMYFTEVAQSWNRPNDPKTYFRTLPKKMMCNWLFNPYSLEDYNGTPHLLECRTIDGPNFFGYTEFTLPRARILPEYIRMGINTENIKWFHDVQTAFTYFAENPKAETIFKWGDYEMFRRCRSLDTTNMWFCVGRICQRHRYNWREKGAEWYDYVEMLNERGYDIHNPKYICPSNVHKAHQGLIDERRREEQREAEERRRRRQAEWEERVRKDEEKEAKTNKDYIKRMSKYFGISIPGDGFKIVVLKSVSEFKAEGELLHHCVYRCGYYDRKDSLILSARDSQGYPIETIEVNLRNYSISQCYGIDDTYTARHDAIISTMTENMWRVSDIARAS